MTDGALGEPTLGELATRVDELTREVRRQGRAAIAAQAAAESCLERLEASASNAGDGAHHGARQPAEDDEAWAWVRAIIPIADAIDRIAARAAAMSERAARAARPRLWPFSRPAAADPEIPVLAEGLRVLRAQLGAVLAERGVSVERRVGVVVDPDVHRVVEVRAARAGERPGVVLDIVRPGYALRGRVLREAEIVTSPGEGGAARSRREETA